jgi:hypothetical protein
MLEAFMALLVLGWAAAPLDSDATTPAAMAA